MAIYERSRRVGRCVYDQNEAAKTAERCPFVTRQLCIINLSSAIRWFFEAIYVILLSGICVPIINLAIHLISVN